MRRLLGIGLLLMAATGAGAQDAVPEPATPRPAAVLFFLGGRPHPGVPASPAEIRHFALTRSATLLTEAGLDPVDQAALDGPRRTWRVRDAMSVSAGFLADVRAATGADELLVLHLLSRTDRMVILARLIATDDGRLLAVGVRDADAPRAAAAEPGPGGGAAGWQTLLSDLLGDVIPATIAAPATAGEEPMMVLPASGVGVNPDAEIAASHLYLAALLGEPRWRVLDPAVAVCALHDEGYQSRWLGRDGRRMLERRFGARRIILSEVISFDTPPPFRMFVPVVEESSTPAFALQDFLLSLRVVDLRTGGIVGARQLYVDSSRRTGWFGNRYHKSLLEQIANATRLLWQEFIEDLEAS